MTRKTLPGNIKIWFLDTEPSTPSAPTQAELSAGVNCIGSAQDEELADIDGWVVSSSIIATPGYAGHQVGNVSGDETYPASALIFYKDDTVETIYSALAKGTVGWIVIGWDGDTTGDEVQVFPVEVQSRVRLADRASAHQFRVNFAIAVPVEGAIAA